MCSVLANFLRSAPPAETHLQMSLLLIPLFIAHYMRSIMSPPGWGLEVNDSHISALKRYASPSLGHASHWMAPFSLVLLSNRMEIAIKFAPGGSKKS